MAKNASVLVRSKNFPSGITLEIHQGDITLMDTDAIVNAANKHLAHGGGVALAIVRRGGAVIQKESNAWIAQHGPISADEPAYTTGGKMKCKYVIHAVGPVWGEGDEDKKLIQAIRGCMQTANSLELASISFPAISTGIFRFPIDRAADIFMRTFADYSKDAESGSVCKIILVLFDAHSLEIFTHGFDHHFGEGQQ
jgi:O-acetyl-ADP-ribose deacetylase (regulator of RNase III)